MELIKEISEMVIAGNADKVQELVQEALNQRVEIKTIVDIALIKAMDVIGERFEKTEIFIPEMLKAAVAMQKGLELIRPLLAESGVKPLGTIVIGTVKGDRHDIGKSLVAMMMAGAGFEVVDLGVDVPAERFVKSVVENKAQLLALSALLSTTMPAMKETVQALRKTCPHVKTIVGGAPVTQKFADSIGADGYAPDAVLGVAKAKALLSAAA